MLGRGRFKSAIFEQYLATSQKRCKIGTGPSYWKANIRTRKLSHDAARADEWQLSVSVVRGQ